MKTQILLIFGIVAVLLISGCTTGEISSGLGVTPSYVGNLKVIINDYEAEVRFGLLDAFQNYMAADGEATLIIKNSNGEIVYFGTKDVKKEDFGLYEITLTGRKMKLYVWKIPISEIGKSYGFVESGKAALIFRTDEAEFGPVETSVYNLPVYSKEEEREIQEKQLYGYDYNESVEYHGIKMTLIRAGFYNNKFRVDVELENNFGEAISIYPIPALIVNKNQYEYSLIDSDINFLRVYSGAKKKGYIVFDGVPSDISGKVRIVVGEKTFMIQKSAWDYEYENVKFEFEIDYPE